VLSEKLCDVEKNTSTWNIQGKPMIMLGIMLIGLSVL